MCEIACSYNVSTITLGDGQTPDVAVSWNLGQCQDPVDFYPDSQFVVLQPWQRVAVERSTPGKSEFECECGKKWLFGTTSIFPCDASSS